MQNTVKCLEGLIVKADAQVEQLSSTINKQFAEIDSEDSFSKASPTDLMEKLTLIKGELLKISGDVKQLQEQKQELMNVVREKLKDVTTSIDKLPMVVLED